MHLSKFIQNFDYQIVGGSEYQWNCFGPDARFLDFESDYAHSAVIFDAKTQTVYEAEVSSKEQSEGNLPGLYKWINPDHLNDYLVECKERSVHPMEAWDDAKYIQLETAEDFLEKSHAIFNGLPFDRRIVVPLDLDNDTILQLALEAHKRDVTINRMVEIVLQEAIDRHRVVNG